MPRRKEGTATWLAESRQLTVYCCPCWAVTFAIVVLLIHSGIPPTDFHAKQWDATVVGHLNRYWTLTSTSPCSAPGDHYLGPPFNPLMFHELHRGALTPSRVHRPRQLVTEVMLVCGHTFLGSLTSNSGNPNRSAVRGTFSGPSLA